LQLSIIIVNYNVKFFLEQCLSSVIKACARIDAEIFVVDNNSTDGSSAYFAHRFHQVQFTWKTENVGFAKANNEALQLAKGEKILFLNPDTIVPEDCFEKCLTFFSATENVGAIGCRMIDGSGKYLPESKRGFPSPFTSFCKMTGLTTLFPHSKIFAQYYLGHLPNNTTNKVDVLAGACMLVHKKILDEIGSFDERFFMYAEDIDLSYRIQQAGYYNYFYADSTIIHFKGESTQKLKADYIKVFYGAMALFVQKHYSKGIGRCYGVLLQLAIAAKAISTGIKNLFAKSMQAPNNNLSNNKVLVMADTETYQNLSNRLTFYFKQVENMQVTDKMPIDNNCILLCTPSVSFKEIIRLINTSADKHTFLIHSNGTNSMVGSRDKKTTGISLSV
jgi:GT2 family glycosyltransferase